MWEYDLANESFQVFVPATYNAKVPHGLLVWMNLGQAEVPRAWAPVLSRQKLIWVSANNTPRERGIAIRLGLALDAVHNMKKRYSIDEARVYAAGYSGGGGAASTLVQGFPEDFSGAYCILGYNFGMSGRKGEGGRWEAGLPSHRWKGPIDRIRKDMKLVLVDGEGDRECLPGTARGVADAMLLDGFERVTALEVPRLGHNCPDPAWIEKGLVALESKPKSPPTTRPTKEPNPGPGQVAQAKRVLTEAQVSLDAMKQGKSWATARARKHLQQVLDEYPATPAAAMARELMKELDQQGQEPVKG
jgi:hypothetical protein